MAEIAPDGKNGFERWVVAELADIKADMRYIRQDQLPVMQTELTNTRLDVRALQTRAMVMGGLSGTILGAIASAVVSLALKGS